MDETLLSADQSLLQSLRAGDPAAYERLVRNYGGRMLAVAERLMPNREDARDAVQDAFLSAIQSMKSFDGRSQLSTWLHRIVVNASLMKLRSKRRRPEQPIDALLPTFLSDGHHATQIGRWKPTQSENAEQNELHAIIRSKIDSLPESFRTILVLRDIEELDTETVANMLEITPGAVKVRLHRARQALRTLLDPIFGKTSR